MNPRRLTPQPSSAPLGAAALQPAPAPGRHARAPGGGLPRVAWAAAALLAAAGLLASPAEAAKLRQAVRAGRVSAAVAPPNAIRLSPSVVQLPCTPPGASPAVEAYLRAARQAVRDVYLRGAHRPDAIAALAHELDTRDALAQLRDPWNEILITTAARAVAQARLAPTLSALAEAARGARPFKAGPPARLEPAACARALAHPMAQAPGAMTMVVVVQPAGPQPLSAWASACQASASRVRSGRRLAGTLPKTPGPR